MAEIKEIIGRVREPGRTRNICLRKGLVILGSVQRGERFVAVSRKQDEGGAEPRGDGNLFGDRASSLAHRIRTQEGKEATCTGLEGNLRSDMPSRWPVTEGSPACGVADPSLSHLLVSNMENHSFLLCRVSGRAK